MSVLLLAAVAAGAGWLARSLAMKDGPVNRPTAQVATAAADRPDAAARPDPASPGRMTVAGRVLDPDGKPVPGAVVDVVARSAHARIGASDGTRACLALLGQGRSDADGRFRLDADPHRVDPRLRGLRDRPPRPDTASAGSS